MIKFFLPLSFTYTYIYFTDLKANYFYHLLKKITFRKNKLIPRTIHINCANFIELPH